MKSAVKILIRYVLSAAGIALVLLVVNIIALMGFGFWINETAGLDETEEDPIYTISEGITSSPQGYTATHEVINAIERQYAWAMLMDSDGQVTWQLNLPQEMPQHYSVADVAGFSRWYLKDYPVYVWRRDNGLLVLGKPKDSVWKYGIEATMDEVDRAPAAVIGFFVVDGIFSLLLALSMGTRFFKGIKSLAQGIEQMSESKAADIPIKGVMGDLSLKINKASEKLSAQEAALKKRDTARANWIAAISHDIRTPLSLVMGYAKQIEESSDISEKAKEQAEVISRQSERIKTLIDDLNLASKLEYDMQPIKRKTVVPAALIRDVVAEIMNGGVPSRFLFNICIDENAQVMAIKADETLIRRAVLNLIGNSIKHNPEGCSITIYLAKEGETCLLSVQDDGKGYPESVLKPADNLEYLNAHGLGLKIVRQIVASHGGTLLLENIKPKGCRTKVVLPIMEK